MPRYADFVGDTYTSRAITAAGDRTKNLYTESTKGAGSPESVNTLLSTPGHDLKVTLPTLPLQYEFEEPATGRNFVVSGGVFYEVFEDFTFQAYTKVGIGYYEMASNSQQVMISCAGDRSGYIFTLATSMLQQIVNPGFLGAVSVSMIDNYFLCRVALDSREFQISGILDGNAWDASDVALSEGGADNLVGSIADHREYWLFGSKRFEVFVDTGALFPFERIQSVAGQIGCLSHQTLVGIDNTIFWLGQNKDGQCRVYENNGYNPTGVSTRAVEYFFNAYAKQNAVSDAVAYGYQDEDGHSFYVISFPSATVDIGADGRFVAGVIKGATWVYDITEKMWTERTYTDPTTGQENADLGAYHAFVFGKHLVGGGDNTGNIYDMNLNTYTSNGNPIVRIRRAPHIVNELNWIVYKNFRLSVQVGGAGIGDPNNFVSLRVSNDGGLTWSNYYQKSLGLIGQFQTVVEWRALGRSMRRAFEVSTSMRGPVCWLDAFINDPKPRAT